jgi:hypothetical protein
MALRQRPFRAPVRALRKAAGTHRKSSLLACSASSLRQERDVCLLTQVNIAKVTLPGEVSGIERVEVPALKKCEKVLHRRHVELVRSQKHDWCAHRLKKLGCCAASMVGCIVYHD